ncbi:thioredoxin fold domain-containing protein [Acidiferrobacter sp.]|uniref:thioredoxin fold domain-containing protein n=1 Tax=Acidiferrobacter sp. TaxID=1872107 RepID=UPI00261DAD26|nr:thioredoxin fold domain-containing protein [Acidiferrobacter sp.]
MTDVGWRPIGRVGAWRGRVAALAGLAVLLMFPTARAASSFGTSSPLAILRAVKRDRYAITEGHGGRQLYVFVDPNCPFCHRLFQRLQPLIGPHHLTVHWIVAGFLRATSAGKAVAILGARRPLAALMQNERDFRRGKEDGGIRPAVVQGPGARGLALNNRLLAMTGPELVPTLVYRNTAGRVVMHQGVPLKPHGLFWTIRAIR